MKGTLITFEGSEGSGKSTQIDFAYKLLKRNKLPVFLLREPGGVEISEAIRKILLDVKNKKMCDQCETLLYMAARAQLVAEVVLPALKEGKIILCDRFLDSTIVYQGYGNGVDIPFINQLGEFVTQSVKPSLTLIFDIKASQGLARINRQKDRIEQRAISYHNRVREGYHAIAKNEPKRVKLIDGTLDRADIHVIVKGYLEKALKRKLK